MVKPNMDVSMRRRGLPWMNRAVNAGGHDDIFVTMVYLDLDLTSAEFALASAVHTAVAE